MTEIDVVIKCVGSVGIPVILSTLLGKEDNREKPFDDENYPIVLFKRR